MVTYVIGKFKGKEVRIGNNNYELPSKYKSIEQLCTYHLPTIIGYHIYVSDIFVYQHKCG